MPIISIKTYLKSIYPFEDITDQFKSTFMRKTAKEFNTFG